MNERDAIVVKVGTGVLTRQDGTLDSASLARLVNALADLPDQGAVEGDSVHYQRL